MISGAFDIARLRDAYLVRRLSPVDVAAEALRRIAAYRDPAVWISRVPDDDVMARAETLAKADPQTLPLFGIPFAVKDNIDCAGLPTTAACPAFAYTPARNAHVVERLLDAGAILMGKTNLDQFATGLVGTRSPYGAPRSVFDSRYISGGSSSGSAVAVAAGLVAFALGTDTAGSGRVPAAFNNIVGLKPTRGLLSTSGVVPACRSLDCVSIFAHSSGDAHDVLRAAAGFDPADDYSRQETQVPLPESKLRFGVLSASEREFFGDDENARLYERAIARFEAIGAEKIEIDFSPFGKAGALLYEGGFVAERLAALKTFAATHGHEMDKSVHTIVTGAARLSAVDAFESQYALASYRRAAEAEWAKIDVLLLPTAPTQYTVDEVNADPIALNRRLGHYTNFVNLLDCAAIAMPAGFRDDGLPFGVTLVAPAFTDTSLAAIADRFHRAEQNGMGAWRDAPLDPHSGFNPLTEEWVELFVVGAHLMGMPLNHELKSLGAVFQREATTAPDYKLFVLPGTKPPKPGLVRAPGFSGPGIPGEVWTVPLHRFGHFVAKIPAPLGIGRVMLGDGKETSGFLCEAHAADGAAEITESGGWRRYALNFLTVT
jgi:allophanate hydrolase